jgi:Ca2+-binding EF-hand superfamily protein
MGRAGRPSVRKSLKGVHGLILRNQPGIFRVENEKYHRETPMSKTRSLITLVGMSLLVGAMSTSAFAVSRHAATRTASSSADTGQVRQLLRMMDADRNGTVSKGEFLQYMSQNFDRRDVNKSGQLERNELSRTAAVAQQLLRNMDRDANGRVSKSEFLQHMSQTFDRLDVNKSGQLEPKELQRLPTSYYCGGSTC